MVQLLNKCSIFAAFTARTKKHNYPVGGIFYVRTEALYHKDIRLSDPHGLLSMDSNLFLPERGKGNLSYLLIRCNFSFMARTMEICNAANNSTCTATFAHETCAIQLTGNPFKDFSSYGLTLHGYQIKYLRNYNRDNHSISSWFNLSGRISTFGVNSYQESIKYVVSKCKEHQLYVQECKKLKRGRYEVSRKQRLSAKA